MLGLCSAEEKTEPTFRRLFTSKEKSADAFLKLNTRLTRLLHLYSCLFSGASCVGQMSFCAQRSTDLSLLTV